MLSSPLPSSLPPFPRRSPLKEVIFAIRAILPLVVALSLLILLLLRKPLPQCSWAVEPRDRRGADTASDDASSRSGAESLGRPSVGRPSMGRQSMGANNKYSALYRASVAIAAANDGKDDLSDGDSVGAATPRAAAAADDTAHAGRGASAALKAAAKDAAAAKGLEQAESGGLAAVAEAPAPAKSGGMRGFFARHGAFMSAVAVCQIGMIAFNIGGACCCYLGPACHVCA